MIMIFFFSLFAVTSIVSAVLVITRRSPIYSALFLALTLAAQAGLFTLLGAFFIGVMQILIYAGAIMILFLFVILSLDPSESMEVLRSPILRVVSGFTAAVLVVQLVLAVRHSNLAWDPVFLSAGEMPLFCFGSEQYNSDNQLVIRIQPDEGILLKFGMKVPGARFQVVSPGQRPIPGRYR